MPVGFFSDEFHLFFFTLAHKQTKKNSDTHPENLAFHQKPPPELLRSLTVIIKPNENHSLACHLSIANKESFEAPVRYIQSMWVQIFFFFSPAQNKTFRASLFLSAGSGSSAVKSVPLTNWETILPAVSGAGSRIWIQSAPLWFSNCF